MPKLWNDTIEAHRLAVREAILDATWKLAAEYGVLAVTMSQIAERAGVGRATLYKYFPDVESILVANHDRHVGDHLAHLAVLRDRAPDPGRQLEAVLEGYAMICHHRGRHGTEELSALLHREEHVGAAQRQLVDLFRDVIAGAAAAGRLRADVVPAELASYCLHALAAAGELTSEEAVRRLVAVTLAGLRATA
ncbi:TetR/AcrR family transcriptional regulator [Kribbella sancticallisti]|uniref:TetR/AcrR family transcriptional regulator n=1 Tax=Kribbella sancticallisti TaxID=460087 RepID=A0ABN2ECZ3_9ACTN